VTLLFTPEARADVEQLHAYIARRQAPARAHKVASSIRVAINRLLVFPHMGRPGRVAGTRELVLPRLPYVVIYLVQGDDVILQRVLHTSQQWPPVPDEEQP
jgi:addiction module RelE/StbE family toxin